MLKLVIKYNLMPFLFILGGPILALVAQMGLENATLTLRGFNSNDKGGLSSERLFAGKEC